MVQVVVEVERLQEFLDGRWRGVREEVRGHIRETSMLRPVHGLSVEEHRARALEQTRTLSGTRSARLFFPREQGGEGDMGGAIAAFETLALVDLSLLIKVGVQWGLFGGVIWRLGTERHHQRYLRDAMTMKLPGCFAMTESGHGSDVQSIRTTATYDPATQEFIVHTPDDQAHKDYIGNAARDGRVAVVFTQLITQGKQRGVHAVIVPIRDDRGRPCPGVRIEDCGHKGGLNGVDNGRLWFDKVRVPREALLDRYGSVAADGTYTSPIESETARFFTMLGTLVSGRVSVAGGALSAAKLALAIAIRYGLSRRQFKAPSGEEVILLDYPQHQRRLLPALATTYALTFAQEALVTSLHELTDVQDDQAGVEHRQLESLAAGLKAVATWHASETIQGCREACGGAGYMSENRLTELKADTDIFTTFEGDNTILLQLVAKSLLTGYRDEFEELGPVATAGFVVSQAWETVVERTAGRELIQRLTDDLVPGRERDEDLLDRDYQLGLFRWREDHVLAGAARRLRRGMGDGAEPLAGFNHRQDHGLVAARAHVHREVLEDFCAAIERAEDDDLQAVLERLCDLYALSELERDRAWFQEHGRISSTRAKMLTRTVNGLCAGLRPHALELVDAFGIPDELLAAPIGLPGGEASHTAAADVGDDLPDANAIAGLVGAGTTAATAG